MWKTNRRPTVRDSTNSETGVPELLSSHTIMERERGKKDNREGLKWVGKLCFLLASPGGIVSPHLLDHFDSYRTDTQQVLTPVLPSTFLSLFSSFSFFNKPCLSYPSIMAPKRKVAPAVPSPSKGKGKATAATTEGDGSPSKRAKAKVPKKPGPNVPKVQFKSSAVSRAHAFGVRRVTASKLELEHADGLCTTTNILEMADSFH
ncbi:hypothetical protein N7467_004992 [Penicillium canescens]|nr:hypothetical protein N7467_004992 [Penicillium canescens]